MSYSSTALIYFLPGKSKHLNAQEDNSSEYPLETFFGLVTLTFALDLDILPFDLHAKIQVCMSVCSAVSTRHTDTHTYTHRRCQNYYNRHITDMGCKKLNPDSISDSTKWDSDSAGFGFELSRFRSRSEMVRFTHR